MVWAMHSHRSSLVAVASLVLLAACGGAADSEDVEVQSEELVVRRAVERTQGASIIGASADGRRVAYGVRCDAGDASTVLKLHDGLTGRTTVLAQGVPCMPGSVTFSADGALVAFGDGAGHLSVHDTRARRTVQVSRADAPTIGVMFSPDSRWFVVASADSAPLGATLDAWDGSLNAHVEIAQHAMWNPFGPGPQSARFSPDGSKLLYLGQLSAPMPVGTLTMWNRAGGASTAIATGVPAGGYFVRDDFRLVAYVKNASPSAPSPAAITGDLVVRDLVTGAARTLETHAAASPLGFAKDTLVYGVAPAPSLAGAPPAASPPGSTLKAHAFGAARTTVVDTNVFTSYAPGGSVAISPAGDRIAYARAFDPMHFTAELRVASGPALATARTIASAVVPVEAFGWLDGGRVLAFLHDPTSSMPGATAGTLSVWDPVADQKSVLGTEVTQIGLKIEPTSSDLLFVAAYDMGLAAGDLEVWNATTGAKRLLGHGAAVMSIQRSPDRARAAFLAVQADPAGVEPPATKLQVSRIAGPPRTLTVAAGATSLSVGRYGSVVYTTPAGVFEALAL